MFVVSPNRNELTLESVDNMNIINQQWNSIPHWKHILSTHE